MNEARAGAGSVIQNVLISNLFTGHLRGGTGRVDQQRPSGIVDSGRDI